MTEPKLAVGLPQHPDEHRPERPILLAVDEEFGEGAALRVAPELTDPVGPLEVGEHQDVEQLGAGSGTERIETLPQLLLELIRTHGEPEITASPESARPPAGCLLGPSYTRPGAESDADAEAISTRPEGVS